MKSWRSTIGGACAALGTFLFGAPTVMTLNSIDLPRKFTVYCMVFGFVLQGLGIFFGHLFSADAKAVKEIASRVQVNQNQIAENKKQMDTQFSNRVDPPKP